MTEGWAQAAIERLYRRMLMVIGRGRIGVVDDTGPVQTMQVKLGQDEVVDAIKRLMEYGFTSKPLPGADAVVVFMAGNRSSGCVIATGDQRYRLHLQSGEVAIHDDQGQKVHLTRTGIVVSAPNKKIRLEGKEIEIHATDSFRFDVNGRGYHYFPDHDDSWTTGSTSGTAHPITPPEIS